MAGFRKLACLVAGIGIAAVAAMTLVAGAQAADGEFDGGSFTCLSYTNGLGDSSAGKMQSNLAHLWVFGYLAGYYRGQGKLEMSDDPADTKAVDDLLAQKCREVPQASILAVSQQSIAVEARKLPKVVTREFSPATYTCGQHLDAMAGAAAAVNGADLAELWAFAFIQGFKNVGLPDMAINPENRGPLVGAMNKVCANNRDKLYLDYAALVAEKVKIAQ
ncbi:MAG: hypothetical protein EXQ84_07130 [Rhodospirillaceae bacterium]|nr:hypothetical protein [Rhodospirillaceae bacterium]